MDPEEPVWEGHSSNWHYWKYWVVGVILAPVLIGFFVIIWILTHRASRTYKVSATKVVVERGLVVKSTEELRVKDIRSIDMHRRGVAGWTGIGDIEFSTAARAEGSIIFRSIPHVVEVRDLVREIQERQDNPAPGFSPPSAAGPPPGFSPPPAASPPPDGSPRR